MAETAPRESIGPSATPRSIEASNRYTPRVRAARSRPPWHQLGGAAFLIVGILVAVVNDVMVVQPDLTLLPGGHNEFYLLVGMSATAYSTWWFGWFDWKK